MHNSFLFSVNVRRYKESGVTSTTASSFDACFGERFERFDVGDACKLFLLRGVNRLGATGLFLIVSGVLGGDSLCSKVDLSNGV